MKKTNLLMKTFAIGSALFLGLSNVAAPVTTYASVAQIVLPGASDVNLNFTESGVSNPYFYTTNWTLSTNRGTKYVEGEGELNTCLVMEDNTDITVTTYGQSYDLYLYFNYDSNGKTISIDGREYTVDHDYVFASLDNGTHHINKGNAETDLFYACLD